MDDPRRLATLATAAAASVQSGMTIGLGSGSTAEAVIRAVGARVAAGLEIRGVATSIRTAALAEQLGIRLVDLNDAGSLDFGIDGADEIAPNLDVIKGGGGALLHEKLVALACRDYLIVAAAEKLVPRLGSRFPLPIEVIPFGWRGTAARLEAIGIRSEIRLAKQSADQAPFVSDGGHAILDCATGAIDDGVALGAAIKATTGVVEHGLFIGIAKRAMIVHPDGDLQTLVRADGA